MGTFRIKPSIFSSRRHLGSLTTNFDHLLERFYSEFEYLLPAFVEPHSLATLALQRGHYHVYIIVTEAEQRLVGINPHVGAKAVADLVEFLFRETVLLEQVIQSV